VVDDALTVRELQRSIFENAGYRVRVAVNGEEALVEISHERPPGPHRCADARMDGFELTAGDPQASPRSPRCRDHLSSAEATRTPARLECGADGYIVKSGFGPSRRCSPRWSGCWRIVSRQ